MVAVVPLYVLAKDAPLLYILIEFEVRLSAEDNILFRCFNVREQ